jgi:uncharacterized protein
MNENTWKSRWTGDQVRAMLIEQMDNFWNLETGTPRYKLMEVQKAASLPHAVIISGMRRVGKSTLLAQMAHQLGREVFYYLNFEDDRFLGFQAEDANDLYQNLVEIFGERKTILVDEIQNIPGWEHFVRRFIDLGFKFFITGSNASLLSRELGTRLTGRYISVELFPFSFAEFFQFRRAEIPDIHRLTTVGQAHLNSALNDYLASGGIPDALKYPQLPLLKTLYDDILYRDVATRYRLDSISAIRELAFYLMSNPSSLISFNRLKEQFHLGSVNTIIGYIEFLQNSWLFFSLNKYAFSVKAQQIAPKKVYAIDTGMINSVGFQFSPNTGKLLENVVYLALRQYIPEFFYYVSGSGFETDFYIPHQKMSIQVCSNLDSVITREREYRAIEEMVLEVPLERALILCDRDADNRMIGSVIVETKSISRWLLEIGLSNKL